MVRFLKCDATDLVILFICCYICESKLNFGDDVENNKSFTSLPTIVKTFVNDTVLLPCYHNKLIKYVRWHRDDVLLADSRHPNVIASERVRLWSNGSLQVTDVQVEDSGDYYCEIMSNNSHVVQAHAIEVQWAPTVFTEPSGTLELPIGSVFEIACEANGMPQPAITWRHNKNTITQYHAGNRQNHLVEVKSRRMSGFIECLATNGVGDDASGGVHLNVLFAPEVYAAKSIVYTDLNSRAHLECLVEAAPLARVQWYLHGVPITYNSRLSRHDTELQGNRSLTHYYIKSKHVLSITSVRNDDFGLYECRSENKIGANSAFIDLTGRPSPCAFKINPSVQSAVSHPLIWQTESLSPILEYKLKFRQIPSRNGTHHEISALKWTELTIPSEISAGPIHTRSFTLNGLQPASIFEVMVLARNHFGWNENSKVIRFATGGEVELPDYSTESDIYEGDNQLITENITRSIRISSTFRSSGVSIYVACGSFSHIYLSSIFFSLMFLKNMCTKTLQI